MSYNVNISYKVGRFFSLLFYLVLVVLFFVSCKKDKKNSCVPITSSQTSVSVTGYNYIFDPDNAQSPCFNPNNPNEIIFTQVFPGGFANLYTYNIVTKSEIKIWSGTLWSKPKWGINNWIIFGANNNIFKIKSNGSSLTQLTFSGNCYFPIWINDGSKFLCKYQYEENNYTKTHAGLFSSEGNLLDTIKQVYSASSSINSNNEYVGVEQLYSDYRIIIVDIDNSTNREVTRIAQEPSFVWIGDTKFIWSENVGLKMFDMTSGVISTIKQTCNSSYYSSLDYNSISKKIIATKATKELLDDKTIYFKQRIVTMDIDGGNEKEFEIKLE